MCVAVTGTAEPTQHHHSVPFITQKIQKQHTSFLVFIETGTPETKAVYSCMRRHKCLGSVLVSQYYTEARPGVTWRISE